MVAENRRNRTLLTSAAGLEEGARLDAYSRIFDDRGLSSDTSLGVNFAVHLALGALKLLAKSGQVACDVWPSSGPVWTSSTKRRATTFIRRRRSSPLR